MTEEPTYTSVNHNEGCDLVLCAHCEHMQHERPHPLDKGGKYAWKCKNCDKANEDGHVHILQNTAFFRSKHGLGM